MKAFLRVGVGGRHRTPVVSTQVSQQRSSGGKAQVQPPAAEAMLTPAEPTPWLLLTLQAEAVFLGSTIVPPAFKQLTTLLDPNGFVVR